MATIQEETRCPTMARMDRVTIGTGHTNEGVVLSLPEPVTIIMFTPMEARMLATRILELADHVDGGQGLS